MINIIGSGISEIYQKNMNGENTLLYKREVRPDGSYSYMDMRTKQSVPLIDTFEK